MSQQLAASGGAAATQSPRRQTSSDKGTKPEPGIGPPERKWASDTPKRASGGCPEYMSRSFAVQSLRLQLDGTQSAASQVHYFITPARAKRE